MKNYYYNGIFNDYKSIIYNSQFKIPMRFLVLNCQHGQRHQSIIDFFHAHIRLVDVFILQEVSDKIRLFLETQ
ncbi:hypothetical protein KAZ93_04395 [Patescibacteria group bacterium]|nr:hypothetical protein [Patescibacteria group bacterium]